jgi:Domain of unknown function (DUF4390)
MTVFITPFFKNKRFETLRRALALFWILVVMAMGCQPGRAAELSQLKVERAEDGVYLSALIDFELPPVVEDALMKGIPMYFVAETDIYAGRWYWTDKRVASATRTIRLAFQPLTRRWRVNIVTGLISNSAGLRATLNQNYDTLQEALSAVQRLSRWRIADNTELAPDVMHKLEFSFRLDLSQLPRPFQIGVAGQRDWNISVRESERIQIGAPKAAVQAPDKAKAASSPVKEADR